MAMVTGVGTGTGGSDPSNVLSFAVPQSVVGAPVPFSSPTAFTFTSTTGPLTSVTIATTATGLAGNANVSFNPISFSAISGLEVVPLPATLPLFASGLGALGLLGWRRKRTARAAA
jgi:hypothetical protein